jgi:general secretion pathway protein D
VTDYTSNLKRVADLVAAIDRPNEDVTIDFIPVRQGDPARITQQVDQLLKAKARTQGGGDRAAGAVETSYDARTGQVVVIGPRERMADARRIVESLDTAVKAEQSPVRFYKLANTTAAEVLATIRGLEDEGADGGAGTSGASSGRSTRDGTRGRADATGPTLTTPRSRETGAGVTEITPSGGGGLRPMTATGGAGTAGTSSRDPGGRYEGDGAPGVIPLPPRAPGASGPVLPEAATPQLREAIRTRQARITSDPHTNSIIVIAPPDVQRLYEQLIRALDKRRPQVLIEATIVTLDTSDNFQLGVEIGRRGGFDNNGVITFSSFGLSTPDPRTGRLALIPGAGFNGALLSTDIADVVLRALATNTRSRVTSAPRILVNDNNVGTLSSLAEFPYASVNASDTIATTSFGDYVQAGTEIVVSPHISESDYLQLEYSVSLSSFTGAAVSQGGTTLPPPRKSDSVQSQVTIPDGSTIVVGGLNRRNFTQTKDAVPILGQLPVLEYLFSNRTNNDSNTTLFVFIRPVILRDDKFEDLKFLSEREVREAGVPDDFPRSEPLTIR